MRFALSLAAAACVLAGCSSSPPPTRSSPGYSNARIACDFVSDAIDIINGDSPVPDSYLYEDMERVVALIQGASRSAAESDEGYEHLALAAEPLSVDSMLTDYDITVLDPIIAECEHLKLPL